MEERHRRAGHLLDPDSLPQVTRLEPFLRKSGTPIPQIERHIEIVRRFGVLAETRTGPCLPTKLPVHFHEELQLILSEHRLITYGLKGMTSISPLVSIFAIEPEVPHSAQVESRQPGWGPLRTLLVPRAAFQIYLGESLKLPLTFSSPVLNATDLTRWLRRTHDAITRTGDEFASESTLATCLSHIALQTKESPSDLRTRRAQSKMRTVREHLGSDLAGPLSLSEISAGVQLSPYHVIREFRRQFGLSPHAFRMQLRVWRARDLLLSGQTISDAAQMTGFSDHAHLTRSFHRLIGVPPSRYRKGNFIQDRSYGNRDDR